MKSQHKTHQTPAPGHHLYGKLTPKQLQTRENLALTCRVCNKAEKLSKDDVNMAYLDSLYGAPCNAFDDRMDSLGIAIVDWDCKKFSCFMVYPSRMHHSVIK